MSYYYNIDELSHHSFHYAQSLLSFAEGTQNFPPAPIGFLNWDNPFNSVAQASANLPISLPQNSLSDMLPLEIVANSLRTLPVAAPVPVPHATRTKAALRTMLSFGDKDKEDTLDSSAAGGESLKKTDARTQADLDNHVHHPNIEAAMDYNVLANTGKSEQTTTGQSKLVIRPISPSTLMALTEPCLMAWCTAFEEDLPEPGLSAYFPLQSSDYNNYVDTKGSAVCNVWGY
ncbi:hypothetical protein BYT27DRAFT_7257317 [Phlegmacium glaucopus]|nr:hypothetical protein BYT27DRAFT_7257317 [Phlegmacium glaucopus]